MRWRVLVLALLLMLPQMAAQAQTAAPAPAAGQAGATLVADQISINADNTLTAEGAVQVTYNDQHLTASKVVYDQKAGTMVISGPITLTDGTGSVVLASEAELSNNLRDGILQSARLVLKDQLQLASQQMLRTDGRYTQLANVVASACQVCPSHPVPLWEIRAHRIVHDQLQHQIYYDRAQFRVAGVPVFFIPRLRMPDPSLQRANGVLLPTATGSSALGLGIKLPYFIAIGASRDLTLTPQLTFKGGRSLAFRYREAFSNGSLSFSGALSRDPILPGRTRGYLFGTGTFALRDGYVAGFRVESASDRGYLLDYGVSSEDRLTSDAYLTRTRHDTYFNLDLSHYESLRAGDDNHTLPSIVGSLSYERRLTPDLIGGQVRLHYDLLGVYRSSTVNYDANGDGVADGRDVARATAGIDWRTQSVLHNGMIFGAALALDANVYAVDQDQSYSSLITRLTPTAAVNLRWPWVRGAPPGTNGATQILEPIAQLVWSRESSSRVPNEDSALVEFDEGNLFSFNRFPGSDIYESGLRANLGLNWSRLSPDGSRLLVTAGRVLRSRDLGQFSTGSGLAGTRSDWLLATQLRTAKGTVLTNRALFDDNLKFSKDELRLDTSGRRYAFSANYVWLSADPTESRPIATSEIGLGANWKLADKWKTTGSALYDFELGRASSAGIGVQYLSDCATVDLSLSRRFTSSTTVTATTQFSLSVQLSGFGNGPDGRSYRRSCTG